MAKAVADVADENQAGYASDGSNITGFSHMHDSGTGGVSSLGNFPIFAHVGCPNDDVKQCKYAKADRGVARVNESVEARPGYFAITLETLIRAEMTVSNHTALYRFSFPDPSPGATPVSPLILAELSDLPNSIQAGHFVVDPQTGRIQGNGRFVPSFGTGTYQLYFCADFSGAEIRDVGTFRDVLGEARVREGGLGEHRGVYGCAYLGRVRPFSRSLGMVTNCMSESG